MRETEFSVQYNLLRNSTFNPFPLPFWQKLFNEKLAYDEKWKFRLNNNELSKKRSQNENIHGVYGLVLRFSHNDTI